MKLKKGDTVIVTTGKDEGKRGKVEKVFPGDHAVQVAGINMYKRHRKRRDERNPGGIVDIVKPINIAKIALICPSCGKQTRVGFISVKGEKIRICRKCGQKL